MMSESVVELGLSAKGLGNLHENVFEKDLWLVLTDGNGYHLLRIFSLHGLQHFREVIPHFTNLLSQRMIRVIILKHFVRLVLIQQSTFHQQIQQSSDQFVVNDGGELYDQ
jgi:hypothetical protein